MNSSLSYSIIDKNQFMENVDKMTTVIAYPNSATIFAAACACIFTVVGILGNLITIIALLRHQKLRGHATTAFVLSLCISDLLFCSFSMPLTAIRYINKAWTLGETLCVAFPVMFYSNVCISLLSMVGITLNRYILIAHNHLYTTIYRPCIIGLQLLFVWMFGFCLMLPPLLGVWGSLGLEKSTFSCTILRDVKGRSPKKFFFLVGFALPCVIIIASYSSIYYTVRKQRQKLQNHIRSSTTITTTTASSKSMGIPAAREREDSRLTAMMLTIFICFLACFLPLTIANIVDDDTHQFPWMNILASILAWASSILNPFIYAASNRTYRIAYFKLFSAMKCWGPPLSPMPSKSFLPSKGSRDAGSNGNFNGKP